MRSRLVRGVLAGVAGTALMTAVQEAAARARRPSADGDGSGPADPWEAASAPAKVARRLSLAVLRRDIPAERIPLATHGMHWGYGTTWGVAYALTHRRPPGHTLRSGLAFGTAVWGASYVQLVPAGLYEPPWRYPAGVLGEELGFHVAYGLGVAAAHRALA